MLAPLTHRKTTPGKQAGPRPSAAQPETPAPGKPHSSVTHTLPLCAGTLGISTGRCSQATPRDYCDDLGSALRVQYTVWYGGFSFFLCLFFSSLSFCSSASRSLALFFPPPRCVYHVSVRKKRALWQFGLTWRLHLLLEARRPTFGIAARVAPYARKVLECRTFSATGIGKPCLTNIFLDHGYISVGRLHKIQLRWFKFSMLA